MQREWWSSGFFDAAMAGVLFDAKRRQLGKEEVRELIRLLHLKKGLRVFDAACGIGRHSLEFARLGYPVCGVDVTETYVKAAAKVARREGLKNAHFEKGELRDLYRFQNSCDLVLNLFTSFGYYRSERDNYGALGQMAAVLKPGGKLVMDLNPRESIEANFRPRDWQAVNDGYLMEKREWADHGRRLRNEWILAFKGGLREVLWDIRVYTVPELKAMFKRVGLKDIRTYRDYHGKTWALGHRLVIIGVK